MSAVVDSEMSVGLLFRRFVSNSNCTYSSVSLSQLPHLYGLRCFPSCKKNEVVCFPFWMSLCSKFCSFWFFLIIFVRLISILYWNLSKCEKIDEIIWKIHREQKTCFLSSIIFSKNKNNRSSKNCDINGWKGHSAEARMRMHTPESACRFHKEFLFWMFVSPQMSYVEILTPKVMVLGGYSVMRVELSGIG